MVLFKRKPIEFFPPPETPLDLDTEVWFIPETKEWFTDYDDYLKRLDYYNTRKFVCEVTGITNYTFWELLQIETQEIEKMEKTFPEAVKEPILRYVQFSEVQRIDVLIDEVYAKFKNEFFPGDQVNVRIPGSAPKGKGIVKEKLRFNAMTLPNGEIREAYCQYRVQLLFNDKEITCNENELTRDRMAFTKLYIRGFIKMALIKSPRVGSPWVVKDSYAKKYRISADYPQRLMIYKEDLDLLPTKKRPRNDLKVNLQPLYPLPQKKRKLDSSLDFRLAMFSYIGETVPENEQEYSSWRLSWLTVLSNCCVFVEETLPTQEIRADVIKLFESTNSELVNNYIPGQVNIIVTMRSYSRSINYSEGDYFHDLNEATCKVWSFEKLLRFFKSLQFRLDLQHNKVVHPELSFNVNNTNSKLKALLPKDAFGKLPTQAALRLKQNGDRYSSPTPSLVAVPKKIVPVEDLTLPFQLVEASKKPNWKSIENKDITKVSELLESWCFLNIYRKALLLDNFTLDDYITAVSWENTDLQCELLTEIFCSLMKCVLNDDVKVGGNNTHGISKDENAVGDGENYLILIPKKGGYSIEKDLKLENGDSKVKGETVDDDQISEEKENGEVKEEDSKSDVVKEEEPKEEEENEEADENEDEEQDDDDDDEDEEDDDDEEPNHNVEKYLFFKKKTWQERLRKRQFKDGQWLIILLGIFSVVEHIPRYTDDIQEIFEILAPLDMTLSTTNLEGQFYTELPVDLRISAITILCELLTSGVVIRNFIDKSLEDATQLRKEKIEIVREYKNFLSQASAINKTCLEYFSKHKDNLKVEPVPVVEEVKDVKKSRGGRPPVLKEKATEAELSLLKADKEFAQMIEERARFLAQLSEQKSKKRDIEFKLNELDIQRVTCVGRDRLFNRYWWFESNGLPTIRYSKANGDGDGEDGDDDDEVDEETDESMLDETYLVGRLFVQGPSDSDRLTFLDISDELVKKWNGESDDEAEDDDDEDEEDEENKTMSSLDIIEEYQTKCSEVFGFKFEGDEIRSKEDNVILSKSGEIHPEFLKKHERKFVEEKPEPLVTRWQWKFVDTPEDLDNLLDTLNVEGEREASLFKALESLKEGIKMSMEARTKLLGLEKKSAEEIALEEKIKALESNSESESDEEEDEDDEVTEEPDNTDEMDVDGETNEEVENGHHENSDDHVEEEEEEEEDDLISTRKTRSSRRIKNKKEEEIKNRANGATSQRRTRSLRSAAPLLEQLPPVSAPKPKLKKRVKKSRRQIMKLRQERKEQREKLIKTLENLKGNRNELRCLEWVNSSAISEIGGSHFEGIKASKPNKNSKKKK